MMLSGDGERFDWPYSRIQVTSVRSEALRALVAKGPHNTIERCLAAARLEPAQRRRLFQGKAHYLGHILAYSGRRIIKLDCVEFAREAKIVISYTRLALLCGRAGNSRKRLIELLLPFAKE